MNAIIPILATPEAAIRWEGRPAWRSAAIRIWKARLVALYFALLIADAVRWTLLRPTPSSAWEGDAKLLAIAAMAMAVLLTLAWLTKRTTRYTIDDHRIVMHYGIALPATLEIPFAAIEHVGIRVHRDHTGDLAIRLKREQGLGYVKLWPHASPWKLARAEPMLRCIPNAGVVGAMLCRALADYNAARDRLIALGLDVGSGGIATEKTVGKVDRSCH